MFEGLICYMHAGHAAAAVEVANPADQPISAASVEPAIAAIPADQLSWLPATCAAVSLRLFAIDSAIIYRPGDQPGRETLQVGLGCISLLLLLCSCKMVVGLEEL